MKATSAPEAARSELLHCAIDVTVSPPPGMTRHALSVKRSPCPGRKDATFKQFCLSYLLRIPAAPWPARARERHHEVAAEGAVVAAVVHLEAVRGVEDVVDDVVEGAAVVVVDALARPVVRDDKIPPHHRRERREGASEGVQVWKPGAQGCSRSYRSPGGACPRS